MGEAQPEAEGGFAPTQPRTAARRQKCSAAGIENDGAALYVYVFVPSDVQMLKQILPFLLSLSVGAVAITCGWVWLWHWHPAIPELVYLLLSDHPAATGGWLLLSVVGVDYLLASCRNSIGYRDVGSKARAHWSLSK